MRKNAVAELALRDTVNFELLAKEAERLGYEKEPGVRQLVKGMIVQKLVHEKVDAQLPQLPKLTDALLKKGYSEQDVEKILGGNILRVMEAVERAKDLIK